MAEVATTDADRLAELEQTIERGLSTFVDVGTALMEVRDSGLYKEVLNHKTFEDYCSERWNLTRRRAYQMIDAAETTATLCTNVHTDELPETEGVARELTPLKADEQQVVEAWREAREAAEAEGTKLSAKVVRNAVKKRVDRIKREKESEQVRATPLPVITESDDITIIHGDFREVFSGRDFSDAAIISDPPYPREFIPLFGDLATSALWWGCEEMVLMVGQSILPDVMREVLTSFDPLLSSDGEPHTWDYRWCGAYLTIGPATRVWGANASTSWKPILVFDRGGDRPSLTTDLFRSTGDDKDHHHWGQNENGIAEIVEAFTAPGDLVVDPFLGGGTTAVVCRELGRRFIGCDVDAVAVDKTRRRLAK